MLFKRLLLFGIIGLAVMSRPIAAQDEAPQYGWKKEMVGNLNFTQTSFSNWTQGGENSWTWQLDINSKFENDREKYNWTTTGKLSYGRTKVAEQESKKSSDEIRLESVFTYKLGVYVNPYVAVTGETQLTESFDFSTSPRTRIANFLDPAYFTESFGLGYEPIKSVKTRLGVALKQTIADKFAASFSDNPNTPDKIEKIRSEVGLESVTDISRKLSEKILFTSKLELFSNLKRIDEVDVRWDNIFSAEVSKYIVVSFNVKLFYDRDISIQRQIKQVLAVGLSYTFL